MNKFECKRCGHNWYSKKTSAQMCLKCKSPYWDKPKLAKDFLCQKCGHRWVRKKHSATGVPRLCPNRHCATKHWHDYTTYIAGFKTFKCMRCGNKWNSRKTRPPRCPSCHAKYYDDLIERNNKGENNPRWSGGTSAYKNHYLLKKNRIVVLKAANYICQLCGGHTNQVHHKDGKKIDHSPENLVAVCGKCNIGVCHKERKMKPFRFGFDLKEIAAEVGCCKITVYLHLTQKRLATRYGNAINQAMQQRKVSNGSQNKQIGL